MRIFILEDEINKLPRSQILTALASHELTVATSCEDAKRQYVAGKYDLLLLDHDMNGYYDSSDVPNSGYQFCRWLVVQEDNLANKRPAVVIHSQNHVGRKNMLKLLEQHGFTATTEYYFSQSYIDWLHKL